MDKKLFLRFAINTPSAIYVFLRWSSVSWLENFINPALGKISSWLGVPMIAIEGFLVGAILVGSVWWFVSGLRERNRTAAPQEKQEDVLDKIKTDLIALNEGERDAATQKAKEVCSIETALQVYNDFTSIFGKSIIHPIMNILKETARKRSIDPLIEFYKKFGDILDSNGYGLKKELENDAQYKSSRTDLANNRIRLKMRRKRKRIIQKNISRIRSLSYGLISAVLLRSVLDSSPEAKKIIPSELKIALEGIEASAEQTLNTMLNDLDGDWTLPKNTTDGIETAISALSMLEGLEGE